ncbi:LacI family DNA-binding transcriptional regulator [Loktanella sp. SALINAS62]|uniref:LacI family DNA-binding transcriptional regulator n=1 Tax=Loktanella sp. SALINAS62 TaxID=2706124 RepID=UPI001B8A989A|nr:LacI family DNA-binding transcriptional regulator [Loktanella sp. SALINAS62]MBS1301164.1 LacI family transcriptional regulator [Loktanella sp. SALINAS62]
MTKRPTIKDLARAAGVGVATVDRALNGRSHVRPDTLDRVRLAAEQIGYPTRGLALRQQAADRPQVRFGFVLHKGAQEFYRNFALALQRAVDARTDIRGRAVIRFAASQSPGDFAHEIADVASQTDAIATSAINHPTLSDLVGDLTANGTPVFALLNDFAQGIRQNYMGLNNVKVGRLAAWMMTTQIRDPGKLAVFVGGNRWHGHLLRETGFQSYLRECAPDFSMLDTVVNLETRQVTYEATLDLLDRQPDLRGIYVAGGGMEGAIAAIREQRPPGKIALIVNELTDDSRKALVDRYATMVIATPLDDLCRILIQSMIDAVRDGTNTGGSQHFLTPQLYLPESF